MQRNQRSLLLCLPVEADTEYFGYNEVFNRRKNFKFLKNFNFEKCSQKGICE